MRKELKLLVLDVVVFVLGREKMDNESDERDVKEGKSRRKHKNVLCLISRVIIIYIYLEEIIYVP